jgi:transcriptional regulator with GAF, ATPase, and Fis domain
MITAALRRTGGSHVAAARMLGITPRMIRYKEKQLAINVDYSAR